MQRSFYNHFLFVLISLFYLFSSCLKAENIGSDELYQTRLNSLRSGIDFTYTPIVKPFIDELLANPELIKKILAKSKYQFPIIEKQLKAKGLPLELKYLAATASNLDASATTNSGATGIWLMAYPVSKMYKLKINTYVDERRDIYKSSMVAAQHFKDLISIYKSWPLAISAYSCSPVMLNKSIRMANNSLYYWDVYAHLPTYCRDLYPKIIATAYVLNFYKEHGIKFKDLETPVETDSILVNKWLSFQQISGNIGVSLDELRDLNPVFKKDIIPFSADGYVIRLPKGKSKEFGLIKDSTIHIDVNNIDFQPTEVRKDNTRSNLTTEIRPTDKQIKNSKPTDKSVKILYKVKKGDNLTDIADWFDAEISELKAWNNLRSNKVKFGQMLKIFVPAAKTGYYKRINTMTLAQKKKLARKD